MRPLRCPECGLTNPPDAERCDCGFVFGLRSVATPPRGRGRSPVLICSVCGLVNPPVAERCDCGHAFVRGRSTQQPTVGEGSPVRKTSAARVMPCPQCARRLRLASPFLGREFHCPGCGCRFLVEVGPNSQERTVVSPSRDLGPCYALLGVGSAVSDAELKAAWRRQMTEYHPDKVAALGPKLRELAEQETKRINEAYSLIVEHRARSSGRGEPTRQEA